MVRRKRRSEPCLTMLCWAEAKWSQKQKAKSPSFFAGSWKCAFIGAGHDYRKLPFFCTCSPSRKLRVPLLAPSTVQAPSLVPHSGCALSAKADAHAAPLIVKQGAFLKGAQAAFSEAQPLTSAPGTLPLRPRGNREVVRELQPDGWQHDAMSGRGRGALAVIGMMGPHHGQGQPGLLQKHPDQAKIDDI